MLHFEILSTVLQRPSQLPLKFSAPSAAVLTFGGGFADVMHFTSPIVSPRLGAEHYCMPQRVAEGCIKVRSCHCVFLCYETVYSVGCLPFSVETQFLRHHIIPCKCKQCLLLTLWFQNIRLRGKAWCKQLIGS